MSSRQLQSLYRDLQRAFDARPTDLKKCGVLLAQLKVHDHSSYTRPLLIPSQIGLIEKGLLLPSGEASLNDMVIARKLLQISLVWLPIGFAGDILEIGAFWSIRAKDVPSFDRYFSQLHTFYTDYRSSISRQYSWKCLHYSIDPASHHQSTSSLSGALISFVCSLKIASQISTLPWSLFHFLRMKSA